MSTEEIQSIQNFRTRISDERYLVETAGQEARFKIHLTGETVPMRLTVDRVPLILEGCSGSLSRLLLSLENVCCCSRPGNHVRHFRCACTVALTKRLSSVASLFANRTASLREDAKPDSTMESTASAPAKTCRWSFCFWPFQLARLPWAL